MKIRLNNIHVANQADAQAFYIDVLGFEKKMDLPLGEFRWLTVVSPDEPDAAELLLEPNAHPAASAYQAALYDEGIPAASFMVNDIDQEYARLLSSGVRFTAEPTDMGGAKIAVFDDTCGNLIQLYEVPDA
jgi:catechol 2,3-dioxygenase-like lactoylglutathione lyase family enzyme